MEEPIKDDFKVDYADKIVTVVDGAGSKTLIPFDVLEVTPENSEQDIYDKYGAYLDKKKKRVPWDDKLI